MQEYDAPIQPTVLRSHCDSVVQLYRAHNGDLVIIERCNAEPRHRQISLTQEEVKLLLLYVGDEPRSDIVVEQPQEIDPDRDLKCSILKWQNSPWHRRV